MKTKIIIVSIFVVGVLFLGSRSEAYLFGMKSWDNSTSNIQKIQKEYELDLPMVSFIFDPRGDHVEKMMNKLNEELGPDKIYHISLSPDMYSAKEVAEGKFDAQYQQFFKDIKKIIWKLFFVRCTRWTGDDILEVPILIGSKKHGYMCENFPEWRDCRKAIYCLICRSMREIYQPNEANQARQQSLSSVHKVPKSKSNVPPSKTIILETNM